MNKNERVIYLKLAGVLAVFIVVVMQPNKVRCSEGSRQGRSQAAPITKIPYLSEIDHPLTNAEKLVQSPTPELVQITGVKANPTAKGVEIILQTSLGEQLQVINRSTGNNFIADIPNAQLSLSTGEAYTFRSEKPLAGITEITVTNLDANTIRVTVTGEASVPVVELSDSPTEGLIFEVASSTQSPPAENQPTSEIQPSQPSASGDEPIELVVTGEQDGYRVPNASTATKTDTPLRDVPQSIQVIPQQVIQDQQANRLVDAIKNVPGVVQGGSSPRTSSDSFLIRGFNVADILKDGLQDRTLTSIGYDPVTVDRIEVLKGPASVLFGQGQLGGIVNVVTKQPLREPYYFLEGSAGSFNSYRGAIDLSGPVNANKTVLYRLGVAARTSESFLDFYDQQRYNVAPSLTWQINDRARYSIQSGR
ncbi:MAG: TonB-dependent receptor plug domain-containing protein [Nostoc sp.]|uniref:TonB-dependent receptor plug domain-containing protein n=1 Tax=Nostoc sp. TaxID=1180 RepID=UPI002FF067AC